MLLLLPKKIIGLLLGVLTLLLSLGFVSGAQAAEYKVRSLDISTVQDAATHKEIFRLEIGLNKPSESFRYYVSDQDPKQLIIDLSQTSLSRVKKQLRLDSKVADKIEFLKLDRNNSRVLITLSSKATAGKYKVYVMPKDDQAKKPYRIVVDLYSRPAFSFTAGLSGKRIAIDPGHGGSDSGAIGPSGLKEKDVTLDVALQVEDILRQAGASVFMTRRDDRDVYGQNATDQQELQSRVDVGRRSNVDAFVSIHANAFTNSAANGTATYYYFKSAADELLAQSLQDGMVEYGARSDRGIHEANFYVVKRSTMPAALVELAFITNYEEEELLNSPDFSLGLAEGICKGLSNFFVNR